MKTPVLAKIAYLTQPAPDVFVLNFQYGRDPELHQVQISKAQLSGIIIDGASIALRSSRLGAESLLEAAGS